MAVQFIDGLNERQRSEAREIVREELDRRDGPVSLGCAGYTLKATKRGLMWVRPGEGRTMDEGQLVVLERDGEDLIERAFESADSMRAAYAENGWIQNR